MGGPIVFGPFAFDPEARELRRNGNTVRLQDQPAQVLRALLDRHGHLVTREEMQQVLWPDGTFVDFDKSLNKAVTKLRDALHDDADRPRYIETIPRRGYRFIAPITSPEPVTAPPRRFALIAVALSLAALAAVSLWLFLANRPTPIASIAVLPFDNLTGDPQHDPEADALTEALIARLSQVSSFQRVISRTSVLQYKGTKKPLPEIAKALRVDAIVEGALLQSGERVKATVRLIHAPRERPIWSQSYDHPARGVIDLQSKMALDLVSNARAALTNQELSLIKSSRSVDPEAYRQFVLGRHYCRDLLLESTRKGVAALETAIAKDPGFADAHAELASCGISIDRATSEVHAALALDPSNARAYSVRGGLRLTFEWDWLGAEADLKRAIELAPSDDAVHCQYAAYLTAMKRYEEALQEVERAIELNPTDSRIYDFYGSWAAIMAGRFELALQYSRRSHDVNPEADSPFLLMCYSLVKLGRIPEATSAFLRVRQRWPEKQDNLTDAWLFHYYVAAGRRAEAERIVDYWSSQPEDSVDPANLFTMHAILGRAEKALDYLELAYEKRSGSMYLLQAGEDDPPPAVRHHPRYLAILKKMNFPK